MENVDLAEHPLKRLDSSSSNISAAAIFDDDLPDPRIQVIFFIKQP